MAKDTITYTFDEKYLDVKGRLTYAHLGYLERDAETTARVSYPEEMDYIIRLITSYFLLVRHSTDDSVPQYIDGVPYHRMYLSLLSIPFKNEKSPLEIEAWNKMVEAVCNDFHSRKELALRGKCTYDQLKGLVLDALWDFDPDDCDRLDSGKLTNLAVFVYDYCQLTLMEAHLLDNIDFYVDGDVEVRKKLYHAPLRTCAAFRNYCNKYGLRDPQFRAVYWPQLPLVRLLPRIKNPHANDSYASAMFVDLMHKFFLAFGLKKRGHNPWSKAERMLIYRLLCLFGMCKSTKPASESKYVTTVYNDYGNYFSKCNLRTWIRTDQAYHYLMCCNEEAFTRKEPAINEPFITYDCYEEYEVIKDSEKIDQSVVNIDDLPADVRKQIQDLAGSTFVVTNSFKRIAFAKRIEGWSGCNSPVENNPQLAYVMDLIRSSFDYVTVQAFDNQILVVREEMDCSETTKRLQDLLEKDLLARADVIPRGLFLPENAKAVIARFRRRLMREGARLDPDKFYYLFLFIYDYVYVTYKEATVVPLSRLYTPSTVVINKEDLPSSMLIDDMFCTYLDTPPPFHKSPDGSYYYECPRPTELYIQQKNYPVEHPRCTTKRMTAMFYDLFVQFFRAFGLSRRSDVKYASSQENTLIGELASCCGICATDNIDSIRRMFLEGQDYYEESSLWMSMRENEYGNLILNKKSKELFDLDDKDS